MDNEKIIKNDKPKNEKVFWGVILIIGLGVVFILFNLNNQRKSTDENLSSTQTDKNLIENEQIIGTLYRNNQYKFRIKFPYGWEIKDGDGPHIVKKATKDGSTVLVYVKDFFESEEGQLLLDELRQGYKEETGINISDSEVKQVMAELNPNDFPDEDFKEMMRGASEGILFNFEGAEILNEEIRYIDNKKAFYTKSEVSYKVLDIEAQVIMVHYTTLYNGNIYMISGASGKDDFLAVEKQINLSIGSFVFENY